MDKERKCSYADKYKAIKKPKCNCLVCENKWLKSQLNQKEDSKGEDIEAYTVFFSSDDGKWVAVTNEEKYKYCSWIEPNPIDALKGLIDLVENDKTD